MRADAGGSVHPTHQLLSNLLQHRGYFSTRTCPYTKMEEVFSPQALVRSFSSDMEDPHGSQLKYIISGTAQPDQNVKRDWQAYFETWQPSAEYRHTFFDGLENGTDEA